MAPAHVCMCILYYTMSWLCAPHGSSPCVHVYTVLYHVLVVCPPWLQLMHVCMCILYYTMSWLCAPHGSSPCMCACVYCIIPCLGCVPPMAPAHACVHVYTVSWLCVHNIDTCCASGRHYVLVSLHCTQQCCYCKQS